MRETGKGAEGEGFAVLEDGKENHILISVLKHLSRRSWNLESQKLKKASLFPRACSTFWCADSKGWRGPHPRALIPSWLWKTPSHRAEGQIW